MPGLRKSEIAKRLINDIESRDGIVLSSKFAGPNSELPLEIAVKFANLSERVYQIFIWTIGHGGRTRSQTEYRIQATLKTPGALRYGYGIPLLLGYYDSSLDSVGKELGNRPADQMQVYAAWDPLNHLAIGDSSSCQIGFDILQAAYLVGSASAERKCGNGEIETVCAFRPEFLTRYLLLSEGGHHPIIDN